MCDRQIAACYWCPWHVIRTDLNIWHGAEDLGEHSKQSPYNLGQRPYNLGQRPYNLGQRPYNLGQRPYNFSRHSDSTNSPLFSLTRGGGGGGGGGGGKEPTKQTTTKQTTTTMTTYNWYGSNNPSSLPVLVSVYSDWIGLAAISAWRHVTSSAIRSWVHSWYGTEIHFAWYGTWCGGTSHGLQSVPEIHFAWYRTWNKQGENKSNNVKVSEMCTWRYSGRSYYLSARNISAAFVWPTTLWKSPHNLSRQYIWQSRNAGIQHTRQSPDNIGHKPTWQCLYNSFRNMWRFDNVYTIPSETCDDLTMSIQFLQKHVTIWQCLYNSFRNMWRFDNVYTIPSETCDDLTMSIQFLQKHVTIWQCLYNSFINMWRCLSSVSFGLWQQLQKTKLRSNEYRTWVTYLLCTTWLASPRYV